MASIRIASKANQATTLPALLVASRVRESAKDSSIEVIFEEIESLKAGHDTSVELRLGKDKYVYGSEQSVQSMVEAFPFLQSKNESSVCTALASFFSST